MPGTLIVVLTQENKSRAQYISKNNNRYFVKSNGRFQRIDSISDSFDERGSGEVLLAQYGGLYFFGQQYPSDSLASDSVTSHYPLGLFFSAFGKVYECAGIFKESDSVNDQILHHPLLAMADVIGLKSDFLHQLLFITASIEPTTMPKKWTPYP